MKHYTITVGKTAQIIRQLILDRHTSDTQTLNEIFSLRPQHTVNWNLSKNIYIYKKNMNMNNCTGPAHLQCPYVHTWVSHRKANPVWISIAQACWLASGLWKITHCMVHVAETQRMSLQFHKTSHEAYIPAAKTIKHNNNSYEAGLEHTVSVC